MEIKELTITVLFFLLASSLHAGDGGSLPTKDEDWGRLKKTTFTTQPAVNFWRPKIKKEDNLNLKYQVIAKDLKVLRFEV